jgi:hypothetical protein
MATVITTHKEQIAILKNDHEHLPSVGTAKKTQHLTITKINWLTLFKEIIAVYTENHTRPINTKRRPTDFSSRWYKKLPMG